MLEHSPPRVGHVPRESLGSVSQVCAPVRVAPPTGATALEVHKMNRHSRKNGGKPSCQHVPEEVSHGENLLSEECPTARNVAGNVGKGNPIENPRQHPLVARPPVMFPHDWGFFALTDIFSRIRTEENGNKIDFFIQ